MKKILSNIFLRAADCELSHNCIIVFYHSFHSFAPPRFPFIDLLHCVFASIPNQCHVWSLTYVSKVFMKWSIVKKTLDLDSALKATFIMNTDEYLLQKHWFCPAYLNEPRSLVTYPLRTISTTSNMKVLRIVMLTLSLVLLLQDRGVRAFGDLSTTGLWGVPETDSTTGK